MCEPAGFKAGLDAGRLKVLKIPIHQEINLTYGEPENAGSLAQTVDLAERCCSYLFQSMG